MPNLHWEVTKWVGGQTEIYKISAAKQGIRLLVLGGVHGDEPAGPTAIKRVIQELKNASIRLTSGTVTFIPICNPKAFQVSRRFIDRDLNRNMKRYVKPLCYEDYIANELLDVMAGNDVVLDIHSFGFSGPPFIFIGPEDNSGEVEPFAHAKEEYRFATSLGFNRCVFGWLTAYQQFVAEQNQLLDGLPESKDTANRADLCLGIGVTENFRRLGGFGVTVECGPHRDPTSFSNAYSAIRNAMSILGIAGGDARQGRFDSILKITQVLLRKSRGDHFIRDWKLFDAVKKDDILAIREDGSSVRATGDGAIIFAYPSALVGGAWLYVAHEYER